MPESSWPENDSYNEFEDINSLSSEITFPILDEFPEYFLRGNEGRRIKSAFILFLVYSLIIALHLLSWGQWLIWGLAGILWIQAFRVLFASPLPLPPSLSQSTTDYPFVSLLVAAKNEQSVIANLVNTLCHQDYPGDRYEVWVVDDDSTDNTPVVLAQLQQEYSNLRVLRRPENGKGGKSGALNQVLPLTKGEFIAVFDADATVSPDMLRQILPIFDDEKVGAIQMRKAISNSNINFWTKGQTTEMALDSYFQQQRIAITGIGELRGNGQFMRRSALVSCGGWNEQTITDDLDLTIRLHLENWDIKISIFPCVNEEGVTKAIALWHQRSRWAEGGYQRYLDYWRLILSNKMGTKKTIDLIGFFLIQYILPMAAIPDILMAIALGKPLILAPIASLGFILATVGMLTSLHRINKSSFLVRLMSTIMGNIYMLHWFIVMGFHTTKMAFFPKKLKWVKTVHQGS